MLAIYSTGVPDLEYDDGDRSDGGAFACLNAERRTKQYITASMKDSCNWIPAGDSRNEHCRGRNKQYFADHSGFDCPNCSRGRGGDYRMPWTQ